MSGVRGSQLRGDCHLRPNKPGPKVNHHSPFPGLDTNQISNFPSTRRRDFANLAEPTKHFHDSDLNDFKSKGPLPEFGSLQHRTVVFRESVR